MKKRMQLTQRRTEIRQENLNGAKGDLKSHLLAATYKQKLEDKGMLAALIGTHGQLEGLKEFQHIKQQHGSFWEPSIQRLSKIAKVPSRTARPAPACLRTRAPS